ncbi:hypothetical protein [Paenibacillus lutrae]|uniref:Uncharacterized protein n=1 Tax=Paenibacillus lutrae TaxID=2078573 RepID=A0A7X3FLF9_9BACL|nr:hypothetical protein [Paenibacillus lutrae]MVP01815.1 hypothetical protein [Paenibacillus lutrae]
MFVVTPQYVNDTYRSHSSLFRIQAIRRMNAMAPAGRREAFAETLFPQTKNPGRAGAPAEEAERGRTRSSQLSPGSSTSGFVDSGAPALLRRLGETNEWKRPSVAQEDSPGESSEGLYPAEEFLPDMLPLKVAHALRAYRPYSGRQSSLDTAM